MDENEKNNQAGQEESAFLREWMRQDDAQGQIGMERKAFNAMINDQTGTMWYDPKSNQVNFPLLAAWVIDQYKIKRTSSGIVDGDGRFLTEEDLKKLLREQLGLVKPENVDLLARNALPVLRDKIPAETIDTSTNGICDYIRNQMKSDIDRFTLASQIKTGFPLFDELTGGLYPGLYVIGAISSLGKTTFIHQMADQIAESGKHVLFFSLEMSRLEMATKSISRQMAKMDRANALNSLVIRKGTTSNLTERAIKQYMANVENRMNIIEGSFDTTVNFINDYVSDYKSRVGEAPVVVVDYLQVLTGNDRGTVRENVDANIVGLKRMSRSLNVPVIVISSVNRANYIMPIDFEALKESGCVEYTADVVLGLQLCCLDEEIFGKEKELLKKRERVKEAKAEDPRKIKLVCLKTRYGAPDWSIHFKYYPKYDLFEEEKAASNSSKPVNVQYQPKKRW